jgi:hypothetical protein
MLSWYRAAASRALIAPLYKTRPGVGQPYLTNHHQRPSHRNTLIIVSSVKCTVTFSSNTAFVAQLRFDRTFDGNGIRATEPAQPYQPTEVFNEEMSNGELVRFTDTHI